MKFWCESVVLSQIENRISRRKIVSLKKWDATANIFSLQQPSYNRCKFMSLAQKIGQVIALSTLIFGSFAPTAFSATAPQENTKVSKPQTLLSQRRLSTFQQVKYLNGTWVGSYRCRQGITGLELTIRAKSKTDIDVIFSFFPHPKNLSIPSGSFRMKGKYKVFNSSRRPNVLSLKPTKWIDRPDRYRTVNLDGLVYPSKSKIVGNVSTSGCGKFQVEKLQ